jgi:outer membrane biosynthesis protein TonB
MATLSSLTTAQLEKKIASGNMTPEEVAEANTILARRAAKRAESAPVETPAPAAEAKPVKAAKAPKEKPAPVVAKAEKAPKAKKEKPAPVAKVAKVPVAVPAPKGFNDLTASTVLEAGNKVAFRPARNAKNHDEAVAIGTIKKVYPTDAHGDDWLKITNDAGKNIFKLRKSVIGVEAK